MEEMLAVHLVKWLCHRKGPFVHWAGDWNPGSSLPLCFWVSFDKSVLSVPTNPGVSGFCRHIMVWEGLCRRGNKRLWVLCCHHYYCHHYLHLFHGIPWDGISHVQLYPVLFTLCILIHVFPAANPRSSPHPSHGILTLHTRVKPARIS